MINSGLYLVVTEEYCRGRDTIAVIRSAIAGGVDIIQMREKNKTRKELLILGVKIKKLCVDSKVTFIVNDDPQLAAELDADGVHVGQEDLIKNSAAEIRKIIGPNKIIGISTHSVEQFEHAHSLDADYLAFGPLFETKTKKYHIGTDNLPEILIYSKKPVVCIGGINQENIGKVIKLGGKIIAVMRAVTESENIIEAVMSLKHASAYS